MAIVEFSNVTFRYHPEEEPILEDFSFSVERGEFVSIIGQSGCGKSTLFRLLTGLETPQKGEIRINGKPVQKGSHLSSLQPQKDLLFPWFTVWENVALPLSLQRIPKNKQRQAAEAVLAQVGLDPSLAEKYPSALSGGMRQRVAFARTLLDGAQVLLLDEPFSALDCLTRMDLQEWLRDNWLKLEKTILFITHDVEEALFLSQQVAVLQGKKPFHSALMRQVPLPKERSRAHLACEAVEREKLYLMDVLKGGAR